MESANSQPEPEPSIVWGMDFLHRMRQERLEEIELTRAILAPEPAPRSLRIVQPDENSHTIYQRTYIDDYCY